MEDSPLSITANVTGILTFVAAILAFIYVRYETLSNGRMEMKTIRESVQANNDKFEMTTMEDELGIKENDDADTVWLKKIRVSLLATDVVIFTYCVRAAGVDRWNSGSPGSSLQTLRLIGVTPTMFADAMREIETPNINSADESIFYRLLFPGWLFKPFVGHLGASVKLLTVIRFVASLGTPPTLIRWYRVRERVLKRISERESLRSQLLSHQVSMANSSARNSNQALQRLLEQQAEVKVQLEELTRLVTMANQAWARSGSVNDCGSTVETQSAASLVEQEITQPSADDGATHV